MWFGKDFIFIHYFIIEHQNRHKSCLLRCGLLNRHILCWLLQCEFCTVMVTVSVSLDVGLESFHVLGLGLEKKVLALVLALKNVHFLGLGLGLGLVN